MQKLLALKGTDRAGILAFYDHRLRAIVRNPNCVLVPCDDHLVHRGDGVFENIRFADRVLIDLDGHVRRLRRSCEGLGLQLPCGRDELYEILVSVARAAGRNDGALRVLIGRGPGGFGIEPSECPASSLYVAAHAITTIPEEVFARGVTACHSQVPIKPAVLAKLKTTNYLPNVLMVLEAARRGVDFSFSFDDEGCVAEAALANVAVVSADGVLLMPEFRQALPGTTARRAAELAKDRMPVVWRPVREEELYTAREILLLGTVHECLGVVEYEGRRIGDGVPGPVALHLRRALRETARKDGVSF